MLQLSRCDGGYYKVDMGNIDKWGKLQAASWDCELNTEEVEVFRMVEEQEREEKSRDPPLGIPQQTRGKRDVPRSERISLQMERSSRARAFWWYFRRRNRQEVSKFEDTCFGSPEKRWLWRKRQFRTIKVIILGFKLRCPVQDWSEHSPCRVVEDHSDMVR